MVGVPKQNERPVLRHFLYLDQNLVREFLGQLSGGLDRETERHVERAGRKGIGGSAKVGPLGVEGDIGGETKRVSEVTIESSPAGEFQRLYRMLTETDSIQFLPALDDKIWSDLSRDDILEFGSIAALPAIARLVDLTDRFAPLMQIAGASVKLPGTAEALDWDVVTKMLGLFRTEQPSFIAAVAGTPKFRFVCKLDPEWMKVPLDEMQGEVTVFGKLQRKITKGQKLPTIDLMTQVLQMQNIPPNRAARRRKQQEKTEAEAPSDKFPDEYELQIGYPAGVLTPIAVYR